MTSGISYHWTDAQIAQMRQLWMVGEPGREIAARMGRGLTASIVLRMVRVLKLPTHRTKFVGMVRPVGLATQALPPGAHTLPPLPSELAFLASPPA